MPIYGNWCGNAFPKDNVYIAPVDELDAACMDHDRCYSEHKKTSCICDRMLYDRINQQKLIEPQAFLISQYIYNSPCWGNYFRKGFFNSVANSEPGQYMLANVPLQDQILSTISTELTRGIIKTTRSVLDVFEDTYNYTHEFYKQNGGLKARYWMSNDGDKSVNKVERFYSSGELWDIRIIRSDGSYSGETHFKDGRLAATYDGSNNEDGYDFTYFNELGEEIALVTKTGGVVRMFMAISCDSCDNRKLPCKEPSRVANRLKITNADKSNSFVALVRYGDDSIRWRVPIHDCKIDGELISYYEDGYIRSYINITDNTFDGDAIFYYNGGAIESVRHYKGGRLIACDEYLDDGQRINLACR